MKMNSIYRYDALAPLLRGAYGACTMLRPDFTPPPDSII